MRQLGFSIPFLAAFAACATPTASVKTSISYEMKDLPDRGLIQLTYTNKSRETTCLGSADWPNEGHMLDQASNRVFVLVDGTRYPIKNVNTGYCVDGCPTYVAPGKTAIAFLRYEDFGLPYKVRNQTKLLDFKPRGYSCKPR